MDINERSQYTGEWVDIDDYEGELEYGKIVMFEALGEIIVEHICAVNDRGELSNFNNQTIPRSQIIAVKAQEEVIKNYLIWVNFGRDMECPEAMQGYYRVASGEDATEAVLEWLIMWDFPPDRLRGIDGRWYFDGRGMTVFELIESAGMEHKTLQWVQEEVMEENKASLWIDTSKLQVSTLAQPPEPSISFVLNNQEPIMMFKPNGDIFVKGELVECNKEVVEGMMTLLSGHGILELRRENERLKKEVEELLEYKFMYHGLNKQEAYYGKCNDVDICKWIK